MRIILLILGILAFSISSFALEIKTLIMTNPESISVKKNSFLGKYLIIKKPKFFRDKYDDTYIIPIKSIKWIYYKKTKRSYEDNYYYVIYLILKEKQSFPIEAVGIEIKDKKLFRDFENVKNWLKKTFDMEIE